MSDRKPTSVVLPAIIASLVLLSVYMGTYYAMVVPTRIFSTDDPPGKVHDVIPEYRLDPPHWLYQAFEPMNWLDRQLRPHVWDASRIFDDWRTSRAGFLRTLFAAPLRDRASTFHRV